MYPRSLPIRISGSTLFCRLSPAPFLVDADAEAAFFFRALKAFALRLTARAFLFASFFFARAARPLRAGRFVFAPRREAGFAFFCCFFFFFMRCKNSRTNSSPERRTRFLYSVLQFWGSSSYKIRRLAEWKDTS